MKQIKKLLNAPLWCLDKLNKKAYVQLYPKYLHWLGIQIDSRRTATKNTWVSPTVFFDSSRYDLISIGHDVTISFDVAILTHDFSIKHAARSIGKVELVKSSIRSNVAIGNNVFIGARAIILPGTTIEDNVIVGAGAVAKGVLEAGNIYAGNPAKKIGSVSNFAARHLGIEETLS